MRLYPAIDVRGGRAVRLLRGDYDHETAYDADPLDAARRWADGGAEYLHVVDLDGAREGRPGNLEAVRRIVEGVAVPVQVGGGLRDARSVAQVLEAGAARAILGTSAVRDPTSMGELCERFGEQRLLASVDARGGEVAVEGWERGSGTTITEAVESLLEQGVRRFVYTPVEVDGTLAGPGLERLDAILDACAAGGGRLIYSGGIGSLDDLRAIAGREGAKPEGVIVGRALYERRFTVAEAIEALRPDRSGTVPA